MFNKMITGALIASFSLLTACQADYSDPEEAHKARRVRNSALIGAGTGALVGALASDNKVAGAGFGALAGGFGGAAIAKATEK